MKKHVPKLPHLAAPALLCCLAAQPLAAAAGRPADLSNEAALVYFQADGPVSGRVVDEKGAGLPGVNVVVKGTTNGAQTDADGRFTLTAPNNATLVVSFVGYSAQEVAVGGRTSINISLAPDTKTLNDVVVVGYLTQNREQVTGSVATVSGTDVRRAPVATLGEGIQGRLPGVQVTNSGVPGQAPVINIRGIGTLGSASGPLYIVDGLWTTNLRDFNPQDVENVQVLKDAASLAPYGSSGANGVIIITTRRGKAGTPAVSFNAYAGVQNITKTYDLMNAQNWATINNQAHENAGLPRLPYANALPLGANGQIIDTDWQKEFIKQGSVQDYNLNFSGGSKGENSSTNFLIGAGYFKQNGTVVGPKFERYSMRINSGFTRGKLRVGESLLLTRTNQTRLNGTPFNDILRMLPVIPVKDPTKSGGYGYGDTNASTFGTNPIALQDLFNNTGTSNRLQGSVFGEFDITSFLRYRLNLGTEFHAYHDREKRKYGQWRQNDPLNPSSYAENQGNELFGLAENTLTFDKSFGDHNLTAVAGYSRQRQHNEFTRGLNNDYGTGPSYYWALSGGSTAPQVTGNEYTWTKESYFGQMTYDYNQRYLLTGAIRRDGSSRFADRWGTFWAASAGWQISKEDFFQEATDVVNNLKLRASYGSNGNDFIGGEYGGSYRYLNTINSNVNYPFGSSQAILNGQIQTQLASPNITWEERRTTNLGFDAGFLEDRFTLSADYYISQTRNALVNPPISTFYGNAGDNPYQPIGRLENRGFEFALGYNQNKGPFTYSVTGNLTTLKNKVTRLIDNTTGQPLNFVGGAGDAARTEQGYEISSFYLYQFDGIFQQGDNIASSAQPQASPGDVRYKDVNNDGIINPQDRVHVGRVFPKIQYGLNLNAAYGNFDIVAFFQGVQGNNVLNVGKWWLDRTDDNSNYRSNFNPWTPQNPSTTTPRAIIAGGAGNASYSAGSNSFLNSTRWLESGSYLRLKNVQIGYTIPKAVIERVKGIGSLRIYVTGQNVFTITKYDGYDPETVGSGPLARGIDDGSYPNIRTFTAGLQLGF
ncbi:TonB-dependent receptor [Hymenobacter sp. GOD-10R]|uniref:SusC/RagA family TonB-linked outer membrane protein n=1 Tax=Hymenobacter sp. GOD-10R TaxID=3093922 RepID=UPI002D785DE2|nr:TonB-dependent receptor [Hymenobacter sp. GOD-10R]WRQ27762.1 TonB-dependent receptor [Hymenobacter sp. GOD-10R]